MKCLKQGHYYKLCLAIGLKQCLVCNKVEDSYDTTYVCGLWADVSAVQQYATPLRTMFIQSLHQAKEAFKESWFSYKKVD